MGSRIPGELVVTSANRKRRWKIFIDLNRILTAEELFFDESDGEWKPAPSSETQGDQDEDRWN